MILPTKHLPADKALLTLGARLLERLQEPTTVSALWDFVRSARSQLVGARPVSYEWFILALDLLFIVGAVEYDRGRIARSQ